ncbi:hypothetical protein [Pseudoalteromonas sp.]|uniref:hypothetical protein n=1 Tax=Pseudoalteromonas sp. TaxID=53249 RepID=UPI003568307B
MKTLFKNIIPNKLLSKFICYFAGRYYRLDTSNGFVNCDKASRIVVVSKKYYQETWKTYPAISKSELRKLLQLTRSSSNARALVEKIYDNDSVDGFDVKTIQFSKELDEHVSAGAILIPETELMSKILGLEGDIAFEVDSPSGQFFIAQKQNRVISAFSGGLLTTFYHFYLSAGIANTVKCKKLSQKEYAKALLQLTEGLSFREFIQETSFDIYKIFTKKQLHSLYLFPASTAVMITLAIYIYSHIQLSNLENKLEAHGDLVNSLLNTQTEIQENLSSANSIASSLLSVENYYSHWDIIYELVEEGMFVQQFIKRDDMFNVRGRAQDASKILEKLSKLDNVVNASFDGVVRKSRGEDAFVLQFRIEMVHRENNSKI